MDRAFTILILSIFTFGILMFLWWKADHKKTRLFRVDPPTAGNNAVLILRGDSNQIKKEIIMFERNGRTLTEIGFWEYQREKRRKNERGYTGISLMAIKKPAKQ